MNVKFFSSRIRDVIFIKSLLTIIHQIEEFSDREIIFSFNIVLK